MEPKPTPDFPIPEISVPISEAYAFFFSEINQISGQHFANGVAAATREGIQRLHVLFQSTGGTIADGIALYNFFKACPLDLVFYNSGSISSIATVAYLGAKERVVSKNATFMIHRSTCPPNTIPTVQGLKAALNSLQIDDDRTEAILKEHIRMSEENWSELQYRSYWFTAAEALENGLATRNGDFQPPRGIKIFTFC